MSKLISATVSEDELIISKLSHLHACISLWYSTVCVTGSTWLSEALKELKAVNVTLLRRNNKSVL